VSKSQCRSDSYAYTSQVPLHLNLRLQENRRKLNAFGIPTVLTSTTTTTTFHTSALNKQEQKQKKKKADLSELNSSISSTVERGSPIIEDEVANDQKQDSLVWKARLLLLLSACLYGSNYTCIKILGDYIPSEIGLGPALRFATAALATVPFVMAQRGRSSVDDGDGAGAISSNNDQNENIGQKSSDGMLSSFNFPADLNIASFIKTNGVLFAGFEVAVWNTVGYLSQARGLESTPASTCAFICSLAVVVVPILDFLAGKNILKREIAGAILAVAGVAFLEMDGIDIDFAGIGSATSSIDSISSSSSDLFQASTATDMTQVIAMSPTQDAIGTDLGGLSLSTGTLYCLVQPLAFGMGYWRMEHHTRSYPSEGMKLASSQLFSIAALAIISFAMSAAVAVGEPAAISTNMPSISDVVGWVSNPTVVGAILWTGVITTALTVFIETFAMKTLTAAETTIIYSMEPVFGSIIAAVILGESMGSGGAFGAGMIIGGCLLSSMDLGSMATNDGLSTD